MDKWTLCPKCRHKLFRLEEIQTDNKANIQIKCSACKSIIRVILDGKFDWTAEEE